MRTSALTELEVSDAPRRGGGPRARTRARFSRVGQILAVSAIVSAIAATFGAGDAVNPGGWEIAGRFWSAALSPDLSPEFLAITARATVTTLSYAVLGTIGATVIGLVGAVALSELWWRRETVGTTRGAGRHRLRWGWFANRAVWAVPRGIHEAVWGLVLISVLGRDPLVAVLAIAIPFGAITAKVVAELIDEQHAAAYDALRAAGAGRVVALAYGVAPPVARDLLSYGFYRFECSIRSSVVLGIVGAGGLGFELALSFQSLRYEQMWTLIAGVVLLSALVEAWSAALRGHPTRRRMRWSGVGVVALVLAAQLQLGLDVTTPLSPRTRELAASFAERAWPPRWPAGGLPELARDALETLQMSIVASVIATLVAVAVAFVAARPDGGGPLRRAASAAARTALLVCRAVPPPVWALVLLFVLFPGPLPGAVALGVYNLGILGRLLAEVVENHDPRPADALRAVGAPPISEFTYGVVPEVAPRFAAYSLYRWEVTVRETVVVGLVGAGGLGRTLAGQNAAFDHGGMLVTVAALVVLTLGVDLVSARIRAGLR